MSFIIRVLKNSSLSSIKGKLIVLYTLNVMDIIFTVLLVNTGMFTEVNLIMAPLVYNKQLLSIIVKLAGPFLLLTGIYYRMRKSATEKQLCRANTIITVSLSFYGTINISHVLWCILYITL